MNIEGLKRAKEIETKIAFLNTQITTCQKELTSANMGVRLNSNYVLLFTDEQARMIINLAIANFQEAKNKLEKEFEAL